MKRMSISSPILILLMAIYVFCACAYIFIGGLNKINLFKNVSGKEDDPYTFKGTVEETTNALMDIIVLNVCCDRDEYLNSELKCVKKEVVKEDKMTPLFNTAVVDYDLSLRTLELDNVVVIYKVEQLCPRNTMTVVTWSEARPYSHYISQSDGHLLELSHDKEEIVSRFSTSSFCLDIIGPDHNTFVALLCPCMEKVCISKCCPEEFYYNTVYNACRNGSKDGISPYKPKMPEYTYHLIHDYPSCDGPNSLIISRHNTPLTILENGTLIAMIGEKIIADTDMYCVDKFSSGYENSDIVNVFYCLNTIHPILKIQSQ